MMSILHEHRFKNAQDLVETLKVEVEKFRNGADPNDDMTMLCLKVK